MGTDAIFNFPNYPQFVEKLRYIHRNPVKAGLCERPEDYHRQHMKTKPPQDGFPSALQ
jgi:hypothetical protein